MIIKTDKTIALNSLIGHKIKFRYQGKSGKLQKKVRFGTLEEVSEDFIGVSHFKAKLSTNKFKRYSISKIGVDITGTIQAEVEIL